MTNGMFSLKPSTRKLIKRLKAEIHLVSSFRRRQKDWLQTPSAQRPPALAASQGPYDPTAAWATLLCATRAEMRGRLHTQVLPKGVTQAAWIEKQLERVGAVAWNKEMIRAALQAAVAERLRREGHEQRLLEQQQAA